MHTLELEPCIKQLFSFSFPVHARRGRRRRGMDGLDLEYRE